MAVPFRIRFAEWVAGVLLVTTALTIVAGLLYFARASGTFAEQERYVVYMSDGFGIAPGGAVEMLGIEIGSIETVEITDDNRVRAQIEIQREHATRIREDSEVRLKVSVGLQTVLGGVGLVVTPGTKQAPQVESGDELTMVEPESFADLLPGVANDPAFKDLEVVIHNARVISDRFASPDSDIDKLISDVSGLIAMLRSDDGTIGRLLQDDAELYEQLSSTLLRVEGTLAKVDKLMSRGASVLDKSDDFMTSSNDVLAKTDSLVTNADGVVAKFNPLIDNADAAMKNLDEAVVLFAEATRDLSEVMTKVTRVVDDMKDITRATKRVFPIRRHLDQRPNSPLVDGPAR